MTDGMTRYYYDQSNRPVRTWHCSCGKAVKGNAAKWSHRQKCEGYWRSSVDVYRAEAERVAVEPPK